MNGKQAKKCRAIANSEAIRSKLWEKGANSLPLWRRFFARLFPRLRRKYADWIGKWYKRTLKTWSRAIYASMHDRDFLAMQAYRQKMQKKADRKRIALKAEKASAQI
jgi:hypothetical protein